QSTINAATLMAPNICSDTANPMPNAGPSYHKIAVMKTLTLDASASIDQNGEIKSYFMDIDLTKDDNADADSTNDKNINNGPNPVFVLGPYEEVGQKNVKLFAVDQSGNYAGQEITIDVYVPDLELKNVSFEAGTALGATNPVESEMPVDLIRERKGAKKVLGEYKTNEKGEFYVEGLTNEGKIYIKNAKAEPVAEYDEKTGKIIVIKKGYYVDTEAGKNGPLMINLKDENGFILISIFYIPDANTDTKIDPPDTQYTAKTTLNFVGVHLKDTNPADEFKFRKIAGDDPDWFGGTEIVKLGTGDSKDERVALIDTTGYIYLIDKRMSVKLKPLAENEPTIFELLFEDKVIGEVFIAIKTPAKLNLVTKDILTGGNTSFEKIKVPKYEKVNEVNKFIDVAQNDPYWEAINDLKNKGIISGYTENGQELFKPNQKISRAEFAKIILKMLCIFPRDEAYKLPPVFSDIKQIADWFYPFTKEGFLRKLIYGYGGEKDLSTGLNPFKPINNITLAEAAKIVIEALYIQGIIDFERPEKIEGPWYSPYIAIAQDLKPYLKNSGAIKEAFVITKEEALRPDKLLTRGEFAEIAYRVLRAYNCFEVDDNNNGIPDHWELKYHITPLDDDPDKDGLKNIDEYKYHTDPLNPDTDADGLKDGEEVYVYKTDPLDPDTDNDGLTDSEEVHGTGSLREPVPTDPLDPDTDNGGVPDGIEVFRGTDPLNPLDDFGQKNNLAPGVYGILADCNSCPCPAAIEYTANLMLGDIIYAVIINKNKTKVFSKSNEIIITQ
ncbi:S-layer homology domain-containing protein, partial [Candidatus Peregrinibacteria bacterium]|nr:S-layer homology domain-containing protein [Candidatus Peregrinibacteria bacterium]